MVTLPAEFTATKYPGYFWNTNTNKLFSLKIGGVLKELKIIHPNHWSRIDEPGYRISHKGRRRWMMLSYLTKLTVQDSVVPVEVS